MLPKRRRALRQSSAKKTRTMFLSVSLLFVFVVCISLSAFLTSTSPTIISPIPKVEGSQIHVTDKAKQVSILLRNYSIEAASVIKGNGDILLVKLRSGEEVTLSSAKDLDVQISSLHLILARLTIEGKKALRLDFRFEKPAIVLAK